MISLPSSLRRLIKELAAIPSIGPRQATRMAFYLAGEGAPLANGIAAALYGLKEIQACQNCFFIFEPSREELLCDICSNPARDKKTVMLVEKPTDLISLENTGKFKGTYLLLGELPKTGMVEGWQKDRLETLKSGGVRDEIILALNPTSLGDFHASLLIKELASTAKKISRLGRGLPTGGEIEFADDETLGSALEGRG